MLTSVALGFLLFWQISTALHSIICYSLVWIKKKRGYKKSTFYTLAWNTSDSKFIYVYKYCAMIISSHESLYFLEVNNTRILSESGGLILYPSSSTSNDDDCKRKSKRGYTYNSQ